MINSRIDDRQLYSFIDQGFPTVLIGSVAHPNEHSVIHFDKTEQVVEHLVLLGHKRIAHVTLAPLSDHSVSYERLLSYRCTLEKSRIRYDESLVRYGNYSARKWLYSHE